MTFFSSRSNTFYFVFLFFIAFTVRLFYIAYFNFDGLYGQDAYAYADWSNQFYNSIINFRVPPNFYWPIGFYLFTSVFGMLLGGNTGTAALLLSLNAGALSAGFMYLLTCEVFTDNAEKKIMSFTAGIILCFAAIAVKSSIVIMADALGLLFLILSAYYLARYANSISRMNLVLCLIFFSFGLMTRYASAMFLLVIMTVTIHTIIKSKHRKKNSLDIFIAAIIGLIVYSPQLYYLFKFGIAYLQYEGEHATWAAGWNPLNILRKDFFTFDGTMHYRLWNGAFYLSPVFHPLFLSLFGIPFLFGLYKTIKEYRFNILIMCLSWIAVYYFYFSGYPYQSIRYTMSFFPALILLSVLGINAGKINRTYKIIFIAAGLIIMLGYGFYDIGKLVNRKNRELESVEWINKNIPQNSKLFTFELTGAVNHYTNRNAVDFSNYKYRELKSSLDSAGNTAYLVIPLNKIKTQWSGLPLEKIFDSLQADYRLVSLGSINEFEGFRIEK